MGNPNVGLLYPVFAPITSQVDGSMPVYGSGMVLLEARNANITKEISDNPLYGDDRVVDNDDGMTGLTVSFELTGLTDIVRTKLFGDELRTDGEYWESDNSSPNGGFGYIRVMRNNGVRAYEAWIVLSISFKEKNETTATREGQINWGTPTIEGRANGLYVDDSGKVRYRIHKTFETASAAKAWLRAKLNVPTPNT